MNSHVSFTACHLQTDKHSSTNPCHVCGASIHKLVVLPGMTGPKSWKDFGEGYMAGSGGVPTRHAVAVGLSVVILQLLQAVKPHKAVLALLLHAQEVLPPACTTHTRFCRH